MSRQAHRGLALRGSNVDYAASKGAVDTLTIDWRRKSRMRHSVNAVRAAYIYTDMHASGGEPGRVDRVKQFVPMKAWGNGKRSGPSYIVVAIARRSVPDCSFIEVTGGN